LNSIWTLASLLESKNFFDLLTSRAAKYRVVNHFL
jgi:hypothetical protein